MLLSRFEGMSYLEIAETMGLSTQAIKSLLSRARDIHALLNGEAEDDVLAAQLSRLSGLALDGLRRCYATDLVPNLLDDAARADPLAQILKGDPHKAVIKTRHSPDGPVVDEMISGR